MFYQVKRCNWQLRRADGGPAPPAGRSLAASAMTCADGKPHPGNYGTRDVRWSEYASNSSEPSVYPPRYRIAGRFVRADMAVMRCIRFRCRAGVSWRTMDREASTTGTAAPDMAGAKTCGGVMVRGPEFGNGA